MRRSGAHEPRSASEKERAPVSIDNIIGLGLAAALTVYLVAALFFPERF
jgi:K+-transporting ATPase KdpF subunit